ncbi:MAG TPA: DUF2771 domain-containing protein, partial [Mycobacterium sp.]|nr:DUF2771 domain-containing protein [Mycobacterium sp.]
MKRSWVLLIAVGAVLVALGAGWGTFVLVHGHGPGRPEISAYSHGNLIRVSPYEYCDVLDLDDCERSETLGVLPVTARDPVQLSVPNTIGRAPWLLSLWYEDPRDTTTTLFRPGSRLAVTVPTVDPFRGRLTGITVQLLTLVQLPDGEFAEAPHA